MLDKGIGNILKIDTSSKRDVFIHLIALKDLI